MASIDDLISATESLLQQLRAVKQEISKTPHHHAKRSTRDSSLLEDTTRKNLNDVLQSIIDKAQTLRVQLPHSSTTSADKTLTRQEDTVSSAHASISAPEPRRGNAAPPTRHPAITPEVQRARSASNSSLSLMGSEDLESIQNELGMVDGAAYARSLALEIGRSGEDQEERNTSGNAPAAKTVKAAVDVVVFERKQIGAALVPQLETLAKATPNDCYNKIKIAEFVPPDFQQAEPASQYPTGGKYCKDGLKVTSFPMDLDFAFPSSHALSQPHNRLSLEEIRQFFQDVFDSPPSEPLQYYVGPVLMPRDYEPFVDAGPRLRKRGNGNIPGVNTAFWYISQCKGTPATLHIEDADLGSVNLLLAGAPKVWLLIPESEKPNIERRLMALYGRGPVRCSQEIRHYGAIVSPALLDEWGIPYYLECCLPGEMIVTRPNTYHQVLNMGANIAESVNIEFSNGPLMPERYVWCEKGSGPKACGRYVITAPTFDLINPVASSNKKRTRKHTSTATITAKKSRKNNQPSLALSQPPHAKAHNLFTTHSGYNLDDRSVRTLTRIFSTVASAAAICQLRRMCNLRRTNHQYSFLFQAADSISKTMEILDKVDEALSIGRVVRRYHLVHLAERRKAITEQLDGRSAQHKRTRNGSAEKHEKTASLALQQLYDEAYSSKGPSKELKKKLQNRLHAGRHWASLVKCFSIGILALVPTSKAKGPPDSHIERIKDDDFDIFLNVLQQKRGNFLQRISTVMEDVFVDVIFNPEPVQQYHFDQVDEHVIADCTSDDILLQYCRKVEPERTI